MGHSRSLSPIYRKACGDCGAEFIAYSQKEAESSALRCQKSDGKGTRQHIHKIGDVVEAIVEPRDAPGCGGPRRAKVRIIRTGYTENSHHLMYFVIEEGTVKFPEILAIFETHDGQLDFYGMVDLKVRKEFSSL